MSSEIFHHPETKVTLSLRKNSNEWLAFISVSRDLEDETVDWNDCWTVKNEEEGRNIASEIASSLGLNKFHIAEPKKNNVQVHDSSFMPLKPAPFVFLDVNPLHETEGAMIQILAMYEAKEIRILVPYTVREEMLNSNAPPHAQHLLASLFFTTPVPLTSHEQNWREEFINATRGNTKPDNIDMDLFHLFESAKYQARYFITRDRRLMGDVRKKEIKKRYPYLSLMTPEEFVKHFSAN
ncbi:MAG: hypothetical protein K2W94_06040 [Alphaproteobacteria bacterium]|nr:hypothetical protein [Alphaproteobacteria bacterium]